MQAEPQMVIGKPGQRSVMPGPELFFQILCGPVPGPDGIGMGQQARIIEYPVIRQGRAFEAFFHTDQYTLQHTGND
jgi:hypothetical protein